MHHQSCPQWPREKAVFIDEKAVFIDEKAVFTDEKFDGRPFFHRFHR